MNIKCKLKRILLKILLKIPTVVLTIKGVVVVTLLIAMLFIIPISQDYNSRNFPKYEIVNCNVYDVKIGDTLSEIAERFKPEHMKLSNYIAEVQFKNSISREILAGEKLLIPVEELKRRRGKSNGRCKVD